MVTFTEEILNGKLHFFCSVPDMFKQYVFIFETRLGLRVFHTHVLTLKIAIKISSSLLANFYNKFTEINLKSSPDLYPSALNISDF